MNSIDRVSDTISRTINQIVEKYPPPYTLMCSGGIDSQAMLWAWYKSNIPFKVLSVRYADDSPHHIDGTGKIYNEHDYVSLTQFISTNNLEIDLNFVSINPFTFFEKEMINYAETYWCDSPQITLHMKMSELVTEGTVIFSGSPKETEIITYTILGLQRYQIISKRNIIPYFFRYSLELDNAINSIDKDIWHNIRREVQHTYSGNISGHEAYLIKILLYKACGVPIVPQPMKYSGFEKIKDYYDDVPNLISTADKIKYCNKPSKRAFDIAFRYKLADTIGFCEKEPNTLHYYA